MATIQGIYVALFGRPADPTGLAYFNEVTQGGQDLSAIGDLASTAEYQDRFDGASNVEIVTSIYQSLFNRNPEDAGLEFFVAALNSGALNINNIAIAILDGAQGTDLDTVNNKIAAADAFTAALDTAVKVGSYVGEDAADLGRALLAPITADETTIPDDDAIAAAVQAVVDLGFVGTTYVLEDIVAEPAGNHIVGTNKNDTFDGVTNTGSWNAADTLDGGLGIDTLNAELAGGLTPAVDAVKNVEIFNITTTGGGTLDFVNVAGIQEVWNNASAGALVVDHIALTTTVGLTGAVGAATTFNFDDVGGSSDSASLAFSGATSTTAVNIAGVETLNVSNTGTSSVTLVTAADAKAVNVTGSGSLELGFAGSAVLQTVDAGAFTGKLTVDVVNQTALKAVTGGSGMDTITVGTNSSNALTVDGGAGSDTIIVQASGATTKAISLTGGEGDDIFELGNGGSLTNANATDAAALNNSLITITDFGTGDDAIKAEGTALHEYLTAELGQIAGEGSLLAAAIHAGTYAATDSVSVFNYGGDAYIFVNDATSGFNSGDGLIKVTGASVADFDATNFQIV